MQILKSKGKEIMKKLLIALLSFCFIFPFASCKNTDENSSSMQSSSQEVSTSEEVSSETSISSQEVSTSEEQTSSSEEKPEINNQVSQQGWIASFNAQTLNNVTLTGELETLRYATIPTIIKTDGDKSYERMQFSTTNVWEAYYVKQENGYMRYSKRSTQNTWTATLQDFAYSGETFLSFMPLYDKYMEFTYNPETRCYEAGALDCVSALLGTLHYENVSLQFENGIVVWIKAKMRESFRTNPSGEDIIGYEFFFDDYQTTILDLSGIIG